MTKSGGEIIEGGIWGVFSAGDGLAPRVMAVSGAG